MKKEEFPTFLNEQPTVVFGRTGRELLILASGLSAGYSIWQNISKTVVGPGGIVLGIAIAAIPVIIAAVVALVSIAGRPLEEWFFVSVLYAFMPKLFIYIQIEEDDEYSDDQVEMQAHQRDLLGDDEDE